MGKINFDNYGGRKWLTGVGYSIAEIVLLACGLITEIVFKELFMTTLLITLGVNVVEKVFAKKKDNGVSKEQ